MSSVLQEQTIFAGRYRILRRIAAGGMGAVYEVMHIETDRHRALKVMHSHILQSDEMRGRFKLEAKVAAHIESDFIVDVFDAGVDEATQMPFLVMELLRGEDLGKRLKRLGRLPPEEVVLYLQQTALALDKTHKASIVHRDLKPENLFLAEREDSPPRIKVLDFGVAKIVAESATGGGPTQSIGTPLYMSPEQVNPTAKLSGASDIYALGMIAYTLLVGVPYWGIEARAGNIFAMASVVGRGPLEPASFRAATSGVPLPPAFDPWFARVTAVDPANRYPTATVAVRVLAEAFSLPLPMPSGSLTQSGISEAINPGTFPTTSPMALLGPPTLPFPALAAPQTVSHEAPAVAGPGTMSLGPSMLRPVPQDKRKGGLIAIALALGAVGVGGAIFYAVRTQHARSTASLGDQGQVAPSTAPTEATLLPATASPTATNAREPAASAAPPAPEPGLSATTQVAPKPMSPSAARPSPSAGFQPAPTAAPAAKRKPPPRFTPD